MPTKFRYLAFLRHLRGKMDASQRLCSTCDCNITLKGDESGCLGLGCKRGRGDIAWDGESRPWAAEVHSCPSPWGSYRFARFCLLLNPNPNFWLRLRLRKIPTSGPQQKLPLSIDLFAAPTCLWLPSSSPTPMGRLLNMIQLLCGK